MIRMSTLTVALSFAIATRPAGAQEWQAEAHANYSRTTQSHQNSWGGGVQFQTVLGAKNAPLRLGMSLGGDGMKQENGGPTTWSVGYDATIQPGGSSAVTPYAGGSVSANWLSGSGSSTGALAGYEYLAGVQVKLESQGPLTLKLEVRSGYVNTQEHTVTGRFGISHSM